MISNKEVTDIQDQLIRIIFSSLMDHLTEKEISLSFNKKLEEKEKRDKLFAKLLCLSCVDDKETLFISFRDSLQTQSITQHQYKLNEIIKLYEIQMKIIIERENKLNEEIIKLSNEKVIFYQIVNFYYEISKEYKKLNEDPNFNNKMQLVNSVNKSIDKSEKTNQLIIHDLLYCIDYLNRKITIPTKK